MERRSTGRAAVRGALRGRVVPAGLMLVGLMLAATTGAVRAQTSGWTAHTSMRNVVSLTASPDRIWAATTGGVFSYDPAGGEVQRYTVTDGLHGVQTRAVVYDARRDVVWIGYPDGVLDRLRVADGSVERFRDIARSTRFTSRAINRLVITGDSLLVATDFGLVVFDAADDRQEVRDSYTQFGSLSSALPVRDVLVAPVPEGGMGLWLATDEGVVHASLQSPNLKDPGAWTVEQTGLASLATRSLAWFRETLYVGSSEDVSVRGPDGRYQPLGLTPWPVNDLAVSDGRLVGADPFGLILVEADGTARLLRRDPEDRPTVVLRAPDGSLWLGDAMAGLRAVRLTEGSGFEIERSVVPAGPFDGLFSDLTVDDAGQLWAAGVAGAGLGFYRLDPQGTWTNYTGRFFEALRGRSSFVDIHVDPLGHAWAGSEGAGLAQVTPDGAVIVYDHTNSSLRPATGTSSFILVSGSASEPDGTLWVTSRASGEPLHVRLTDGTWAAARPQGCRSEPISATYGDLIVDSFGQKWIIVRDLGNLNRVLGLLILDTGDDPTDGADDVCQFLGERGAQGQGLPSVTITALAEDRDGLIWIGTEDGLAYVINNGIAAADPNTLPIWPQWNDREEGVFVLDGLRVNDIAVDPANRLWVATEEGAYLIRQVGNGYERVAHFTTENTPLFSDVIVSIAVDGRTGRVYFATDRGLISYQGDAVNPVEQTQDLIVFPNPARLSGGGSDRICVQRLVEETEVRILTVDGTLIRRIDARGGQTCWDGRDRQNRPVPSGVYLVVAVGANGEGTAYGKVAILR
ncbi:hypothetical protein AWN76_004895 [Rhodothermaceae bacterium RA]|nr:hypothetical protein AWN76_004895 [Rhodothermaceae bacterium RA]